MDFAHVGIAILWFLTGLVLGILFSRKNPKDVELGVSTGKSLFQKFLDWVKEIGLRKHW